VEVGSCDAKATKIGAETLLAKMIALVEQAQAEKPPIQHLLDRVSAIFVPTVIAIAIATFVVWALLGLPGRGLVSFLSVLVIACPCAMGLATPTAILVGTSVAASRGILISGVSALERAKSIRTVLIDKTGTLTEGKPSVVAIHAVDRAPENWLQLAASVEAHSEHPLAKSVTKYAESKSISILAVEGFEQRVGQGVSGIVDGHGVNVRRSTDSECELFLVQHETATSIAVDVDQQLAGLIAIADAVRTSAKQGVRALRAMGIDVVMLTGDREPAARAVAEKVGIDHVIAGVLPNEKFSNVNYFRAMGPVAMVGDGINDAAALALADVGIAMGTGTDIAMEAADITLVRSDLRLVAEALKVSRATMYTITQNLVWAFGYNVIAIPLAAGALIPWLHWELSPTVASAAMALSSVSVVANSLRLRWR
jgi:Cu+-exporting ATPase